MRSITRLSASLFVMFGGIHDLAAQDDVGARVDAAPEASGAAPASPSAVQPATPTAPSEATPAEPAAPAVPTVTGHPESRAGFDAAAARPAPAYAPPPETGTEQRSAAGDELRPASWSIGAGLSGSFEGSALVGGSGGLPQDYTSTDSQVLPTAFIELRLGRAGFLLAQPTGAYSEWGDPERAPFWRGSAALALGARWVANPGGPVEVGMMHVVEFGYDRAGSKTRRFREDDSGWDTMVDSELLERQVGVGSVSGIVAERRLLPRLWVRLRAMLLEAGWARRTETWTDEDGFEETMVAHSAGIALTFRPALELRLEF